MDAAAIEVEVRRDVRQRAAAAGITLTPVQEREIVAVGCANVRKFRKLIPAVRAMGEASTRLIEERLIEILEGPHE